MPFWPSGLTFCSVTIPRFRLGRVYDGENGRQDWRVSAAEQVESKASKDQPPDRHIEATIYAPPGCWGSHTSFGPQDEAKKESDQYDKFECYCKKTIAELEDNIRQAETNPISQADIDKKQSEHPGPTGAVGIGVGPGVDPGLYWARLEFNNVQNL